MIEFVEQLGGTSFAYAPNFATGPVIPIADSAQDEVQTLQQHRLAFQNKACLLFAADGNRIPAAQNDA